MPKIKEITFPDGATHKVEELNFEIINEDWNEYTLEDGTQLKMKTSLLKVFWVLDNAEKRMYTTEGDPRIIVRSNNQVIASE